jgi:hypothetical protein
MRRLAVGLLMGIVCLIAVARAKNLKWVGTGKTVVAHQIAATSAHGTYVGDTGGILRSLDGVTWDRVPYLKDDFPYTLIAPHPNDTILLASGPYHLMPLALIDAENSRGIPTKSAMDTIIDIKPVRDAAGTDAAFGLVINGGFLGSYLGIVSRKGKTTLVEFSETRPNLFRAAFPSATTWYVTASKDYEPESGVRGHVLDRLARARASGCPHATAAAIAETARVAALRRGRVYRTTDAGKTWTWERVGYDGAVYGDIDCASEDECLVTTTLEDASSAVFRRSPSGEWTLAMSAGWHYFDAVRYAVDEPKKLVALAGWGSTGDEYHGFLRSSVNGGKTWSLDHEESEVNNFTGVSVLARNMTGFAMGRRGTDMFEIFAAS